MWFGRAIALTAATGADATQLRVNQNHILYHLKKGDKAEVDTYLGKVMVSLYRALAMAELNAPAASQGAFIRAGSALDAMVSVGKVLQTATTELLIVDPYMDEKALTDFAGLAAETVTIRMLADGGNQKPTLRPAATRWIAQYGATRPLEVRLTAPRTLHDRLIVVDSNMVWTLTQSLNAFAARSAASIVRVDTETAALKVAAYEAMWQAAVPL